LDGFAEKVEYCSILLVIRKEFEILRQKYKPVKIRQLFIGESPPANGTFFYKADSNLYRYTRMAFMQAFGDTVVSGEDFLGTFQSLGSFLDDLCPTPLNRLNKHEREYYRERSVSGLAARIALASPQEIVVVMKEIVPTVIKAISLANVDLKHFYSLPFPAQGHQKEYVNGLRGILLSNTPGVTSHTATAVTRPERRP